jgi:uncharacterized membrane protein YccC
MQYFEMPDKFVGILSAVLVVQPSVGQSLGTAAERVLATLIGCLIGIFCLVLLPPGYGTAAAIALSMLLVNAIAALRPAWRYGVVAAVALALGADSNMLQTAMDRSLSIGLGSIIGALTALLVWPDRSEKRAWRHLRAALRASARRLGAAVAPATGSAGNGADGGAAHAFHSSIADARTAADSARLETTNRLHDELELVERLYNSVVMVGRAARTSHPLLQGDPALQETVDTLKSDTSCLLTRLAEEEDIAPDQVASLRERLTAAEDRILQGELSAVSANRRQALIFAFQEILEFLEAIVRSRAARRG